MCLSLRLTGALIRTHMEVLLGIGMLSWHFDPQVPRNLRVLEVLGPTVANAFQLRIGATPRGTWGRVSYDIIRFGGARVVRANGRIEASDSHDVNCT